MEIALTSFVFSCYNVEVVGHLSIIWEAAEAASAADAVAHWHQGILEELRGKEDIRVLSWFSLVRRTAWTRVHSSPLANYYFTRGREEWEANNLSSAWSGVV